MSIEQTVTIPAAPDVVYQILTDAARFAAMSGGAPAEIDAAEGGAFSLFGGAIVGRNVECVPNQRLVQAWRVGEWAEGVYSITSFELSAVGDGTQIILRQSGFPEDARDHLDPGWDNMYWEPMKKLVG